jgi:hypothetical protein
MNFEYLKKLCIFHTKCFLKNNFGNYNIYYVDKILSVKDVKTLCKKIKCKYKNDIPIH